MAARTPGSTALSFRDLEDHTGDRMTMGTVERQQRKSRVRVSKPKALPFIADPLWYKDAVIYQVHVKSFFDANNDGVGDFEGLIEKLDYIVDLGVNTLWLLPFYPSPRRDDGY